ncbi:MAG: DUF2199 domain-containing protein [Patescibacteria group bacterium]
MSFVCSSCGQTHDDLPLDWVFKAPFYWRPEMDMNGEKTFLNPDLCRIDNDYFIRAVLKIPILNTDQAFVWGVWVSLSEANFKRYLKLLGTKQEPLEHPYFGWLSSSIPVYPETLNIKTNVHFQGRGKRPVIELDHTSEHLLCREQHDGVTMDRVHELIDLMRKQSTE